jgi:drug/metabolite transporter (DMT)-like permease
MSTWLFWFGTLLLFAGSLSSGYVWYGKILEIIKKEKAKKIWIAGTILLVIGLIFVFFPLISGSLPEEAEATKKVAESWSSFFWAAIIILLIGSLPFGIIAQSRVLDMVKLETAQKVFKISFILLAIGSAMLLWAMMPGHMLP